MYPRRGSLYDSFTLDSSVGASLDGLRTRSMFSEHEGALIWTSRAGEFGRRSVCFGCDGTWYGPQGLTGLEQGWCTLGIVAFHMDLKG